MKVTYTKGSLSVEIDGDKQKDVFSELAKFQEVFENNVCGKCKETNIRFVVRTVGANDFYELHCQGCKARMAFGQHQNKEGTLFPRRKDSDGGWLPNGGWMKYNPDTKREE